MKIDVSDTLAAAGEAIRIIVADEQATDRALVQQALRRVGFAYEIREACDAADLDRLLAEVDGHGAHLIMTCLDLPGFGGLEGIRRLKQDPRTRLTPLIAFFTPAARAVQQKKLVRDVYEAGANSAIEKSDSIEVYAARLQEAGLYWGRTVRLPV
ncbi:MAG: response regulator [Phycisphaerae bacterium]|jgi:two-component system response regulator